MADNSARGKEARATLERELKNRDRKEKSRPLGIAVISLLAIVALVGGIWFLSTRDGSKAENLADPTDTPTTSTEQDAPEDLKVLSGARAKALPATVSCEYEETGRDNNGAKVPAAQDIPAEGTVTLSFTTGQGDIEMELDRALAPCTVNAISDLASQGYYDGSVCHRMTAGGLNVLQCGDPTGSGAGGPGFQFANEYPTDELEESESGKPAIYPEGSIAMANAGPGTNGSQFFINYADSTLTPDYTYFGNLTSKGKETIAKIAKAGVADGAPDGAPAEEVKITKATVAK
ncbi:isomerase [Corynebacterium phocae]|uniref:Isomerase n=1 Tax=Corynebacterium phocae TaxID=161895 RepID=A0A1L7D2X9_9CORY|nr:peptidylprolyl isomerase [Corynebacterium phocae]APT92427.1 isomerase [Corynebacterium phocae]KAA8725027.1 peptidylprolyl isomerase [Corynebacterium phocae]